MNHNKESHLVELWQSRQLLKAYCTNTMLRIIAFSRNCGSGSGKRINGIKGQADDALGSRVLFYYIYTDRKKRHISPAIHKLSAPTHKSSSQIKERENW